jgi:hypothetical protein
MAKHHYTRRGFMGLSGAGIAGVVGVRWLGGTAVAAVDSAQDPDFVVFNAKVYTVDPLTPRAEAFAIKAGRFVAVGSTEDVKTLIGKRTQTFDAKQMTVVPGFIDAHNHAPGAILLYEVLVGNPYEVEFVTVASIVDKLRAKARETPPRFWVEGYFSTTPRCRTSARLTCTTSTRCRATTRSRSVTAAATPRITTARRWRWRASPGIRPTRPPGPSTATPTASSTAG